MCTKELILGEKLADALQQLRFQRVRNGRAAARSDFFDKLFYADCIQPLFTKNGLIEESRGKMTQRGNIEREGTTLQCSFSWSRQPLSASFRRRSSFNLKEGH